MSCQRGSKAGLLLIGIQLGQNFFPSSNPHAFKTHSNVAKSGPHSKRLLSIDGHPSFPMLLKAFCQISSARKLLARPNHTFLVFSWSETSDMMMQEMGTNPDNYQLIKSLEYYQTIIVIERIDRMLAHSNSHVSSNS